VTGTPSRYQKPAPKYQFGKCIIGKPWLYKSKGKGHLKSFYEFEDGADLGLGSQLTDTSNGWLTLLCYRAAVTFSAKQHHCPLPVPSYTAW